MSAATDLVKHHQHIIKELTLIPGTAGIFDVLVDGNLVFSKHAVDRHAEDGEVLRLFQEHIGQ